MSTPQQQRDIRGVPLGLLWLALALITTLVVYVLPFAFAQHMPVYSAAYIAGCNNRVAALGMAAMGVVAAVVCWRWRLGRAPQQAALPLPLRWLGACVAAAVVFTGVLGGLAVRTHMYWGDAGYFYNQLRSGVLLHRTLYSGFEFPYGPLLFAWPAAFVKALRPLGISMGATYMASLAALQVLGLGALFYTLQAMPMRRGLKLAALLLITLGSLVPLLSINYAMLRFLLPFAALVWLTRQRALAPALALAALGEMAELATSPEMGVAFAAGVFVFSVYRALTEGRRWLWLTLACITGAALFVALVGPGYFLDFGRLAHGEYNLVVEPLPHLLLLTLAAVGLAPLAVAGAVRSRSPYAGMLLATFAAGLTLLAPALGRCDPLHAYFNGLGLYLLAFVAVDAAAPSWRRAWVTAFALLVLLTQSVNVHVYQRELRLALRTSVPDPNEGIDVAALEAAIGPSTVTAPFLAPQTVLDQLTAAGLYQPDYFCGMLTVWDLQAEQQKIAQMRQARFALAPTEPVRETELIDNGRIKRMERFGLRYPQRNPPFYIGPPIYQELAEHWVSVGHFGAFTLWRRTS